MDLIEKGLSFSEGEACTIARDLWSRFEGQADSSISLGLTEGNGIHGLIQLRRAHRYKLPEANQKLPFEMGTQPNYQSDLPRQKSEEFTSRCLENRFQIEVEAPPSTEDARKTADKAEWLLTYGAATMQQRTRTDWQKALVQGACDYAFGVIHWRKAADQYPTPPDYEYKDEIPTGSKRFQPSDEVVGADPKKGKYRETADSLSERTQRAKAIAPFPWHVEVPQPDSIAFTFDTSQKAGPAALVWVREVGLLDYNKEIASAGAKLVTGRSAKGNVKITLEQLKPGSGVEMETPAPVGNLPSVMGWSQKVGMLSLWTRNEYYEMVSPHLITGSSGMSLQEDDWIQVKGMKHGYGRVPFAIACASVNENENDPALRYRPALDGVYQLKPIYDYHRSLETSIAIRSAMLRYYIKTSANTAPVIGGDEEGDPIDLQRDSEMAERLAPGEELTAVTEPDLNPAFIRNRELAGQELVEAAPQTGTTPIEANTRPWAIRLGQAQANTYPTMVMMEVDRCLQEMFDNWIEVMAKAVDDGGLGVSVTVYGQGTDKKTGQPNGQPNKSKLVTMDPEEWDGLWLSVSTDKVSAAEQTTQLQMGLELLNNPTKIRTREMFVSEDLGVQDSTSYMQDVYAEEAIIPFLKQIITQRMAKKYGNVVVVGADGTMVGPGGNPIEPTDALRMKGWTQPPGTTPPGGTPGQASLQGATPQTNMSDLAPLQVNGTAPMGGMTA